MQDTLYLLAMFFVDFKESPNWNLLQILKVMAKLDITNFFTNLYIFVSKAFIYYSVKKHS